MSVGEIIEIYVPEIGTLYEDAAVVHTLFEDGEIYDDYEIISLLRTIYNLETMLLDNETVFYLLNYLDDYFTTVTTPIAGYLYRAA